MSEVMKELKRNLEITHVKEKNVEINFTMMLCGHL